MSASAVLLRRLGSRLRELRLAAGLSQEELADRVSMSSRTVMRAENASNAIGDRDLKRWLDVCGADPDTQDYLINLGRQCRRRGGWWSAYKDLLPGPYVELEAEAAEVRNYEPLLVPGLLQTEDYARTAISTLSTATPEDIDRHVAARMKRQKRVTNRELAVHTVIDEAVLHQLCQDRDIARGQLERLAEITELPNVTVQVIPFGTGIYGAAGHSLVILKLPYVADPDIAMAETLAGEKYFDEAAEVAMYNSVFDKLATLALDDEDSVKRIKTLMAQLTP